MHESAQEDKSLETIIWGLTEVAVKLEDIDERTRRIEMATLHLCDKIMPGHPEIAKIREAIEEHETLIE